MAVDREDLIKRVLSAKSAEEIKDILSAAGEEISIEEAEHLYDKAQAQEQEQEDRKLSLEEMQAVSGGIDPDRNWLTDGCAATVEAGSWCMSNDSCKIWSVIYDNEPDDRFTCPNCHTKTMYNSKFWKETTRYGPLLHRTYTCKNCGYERPEF